MDARQRQDLDNHITGHGGEDQLRGQEDRNDLQDDRPQKTVGDIPFDEASDDAPDDSEREPDDDDDEDEVEDEDEDEDYDDDDFDEDQDESDEMDIDRDHPSS